MVAGIQPARFVIPFASPAHRQPFHFALELAGQHQNMRDRQHQHRLALLSLHAMLGLEFAPAGKVEGAGHSEPIEQASRQVMRFGHGVAFRSLSALAAKRFGYLVTSKEPQPGTASCFRMRMRLGMAAEPSALGF